MCYFFKQDIRVADISVNYWLALEMEESQLHQCGQGVLYQINRLYLNLIEKLLL